MNSRLLISLIAFIIFTIPFTAQGQVPVIPIRDTTKPAPVDTLIKKPDSAKLFGHSPGKAATRSAIIPGWGQAYNKKYWKIPIIYAALGITTYVFVDNMKTYREYRHAYTARIDAQPPTNDSTEYDKLKDIYKVISPESIRSARDEFRRYIDYSALFFILFWGLNVVDAAVDAHLKSFDVSPDLGLKIKAGHSDMAGTNGISLVLYFK